MGLESSIGTAIAGCFTNSFIRLSVQRVDGSMPGGT
jgi:hypothetical protein